MSSARSAPAEATTPRCGPTAAPCAGASTLSVPTSPPSFTFIQVSAGETNSCGVIDTGGITCWGANGRNQSLSPVGSYIVPSVSAGFYNTCGVRSDGTLSCWGVVNPGNITPPDGRFIQVTSGVDHICGVRATGAVACSGNPFDGITSPPPGTFTQISAGTAHTCGRRTDGKVACWGLNYYGQATPPGHTYISLSTGDHHNCGLIAQGYVSCWGAGGSPLLTAGHFLSVSAGQSHTCGVKENGALLCEGSNSHGQSVTPPDARAFEISAGGRHTCRLGNGATRTLLPECWGSGGTWATAKPSVQVSAGDSHTCQVVFPPDEVILCNMYPDDGRATPVFTERGASPEPAGRRLQPSVHDELRLPCTDIRGRRRDAAARPVASG